MKKKDFYRRINMPGFLLFTLMAACMFFTGCGSFGSYALNEAVIKYDKAVLDSEQQLLLFNILRMHDDQPLHFTSASSIAANFSLSSTGTLGPLSYSRNQDSSVTKATSAALSLASTVTENPMITITPMQGKDFAERLLSPIDIRFVNTTLIQYRGDMLDKMLRLAGAEFVMMDREKSAKIFNMIKDAAGKDNPKKKFSKGKNDQRPKNASKETNNNCQNKEDNKKPFKYVKDFNGNGKYEYKYHFADEEIIKNKNLQDDEKKKHEQITDLLKDEGFNGEEVICLLNLNECSIKNKPPKIKLGNGKPVQEPDLKHYELFRKIVLHLKALTLVRKLNIVFIDIPDEGIVGTQKKNGDIKDSTKDMVGLYENNYIWEEETKTEKAKKDNAVILKKKYTITVLTDFNDSMMNENARKKLIEKINEDFGITGNIKLGESVIVVLLRGGYPEEKSWPIYGYFRLRNFMQVMRFLAESVNKDEPGYEVEYNVPPSKLTISLIEKFNDEKKSDMVKLPQGCLDNPDRTLAINKSGIFNGNNPLVEVDYKGNFWIPSALSPRQAGEQTPSSVQEGQIWIDPSPPRWDGMVFSMLYDIFQFNRNTPDVKTPSVTIAK